MGVAGAAQAVGREIVGFSYLYITKETRQLNNQLCYLVSFTHISLDFVPFFVVRSETPFSSARTSFSLVPRRSRPRRRTSGRLSYISCHRGVASVGVIEALIALRMQFIREM